MTASIHSLRKVNFTVYEKGCTTNKEGSRKKKGKRAESSVERLRDGYVWTGLLL